MLIRFPVILFLNYHVDSFLLNKHTGLSYEKTKLFNKRNDYSLLTKEEEHDLFRNLNSNTFDISNKCREELVYRNQRLVRSIVKKYFYTGLEINDIIQEGNYGLVKAIDMFDVSKDVKFATYATYWIKAYINNCIQNQARMIRLPYHIHDKLRIMKKAETNNTYTEIDKILNMKKEKLEKIKKASLDTLSFDTYSVSSDNVLIDTLVYDPGSSIENSLYDSIISNLEENEKLVIFYRYYYKNNLNLTSSKLNMNKRKVRKIEKNAIKKLKNSLVKF